MTTPNIPGCDYEAASIAKFAVSQEDLDLLLKTLLFGDEDRRLKQAAGILEPQVGADS